MRLAHDRDGFLLLPVLVAPGELPPLLGTINMIVLLGLDRVTATQAVLRGLLEPHTGPSEPHHEAALSRLRPRRAHHSDGGAAVRRRGRRPGPAAAGILASARPGASARPRAGGAARSWRSSRTAQPCRYRAQPVRPSQRTPPGGWHPRRPRWRGRRHPCSPSHGPRRASSRHVRPRVGPPAADRTIPQRGARHAGRGGARRRRGAAVDHAAAPAGPGRTAAARAHTRHRPHSLRRRAGRRSGRARGQPRDRPGPRRHHRGRARRTTRRIRAGSPAARRARRAAPAAGTPDRPGARPRRRERRRGPRLLRRL